MNEALINYITILQNQTNMIDKGWQFYSIVTLGLLGLIFGNERIKNSYRICIYLVIGYIVFCIGNLFAIIQAQNVYAKYCNLVPLLIDKNSSIEHSNICAPLDIYLVSTFYIGMAITISLTILLSSKHYENKKLKAQENNN